MLIDATFDVRTDARGRDPDLSSPTLRRYHQLLWSKALPCGRPFTLDTVTPRRYLHHSSELGEFSLASDGGMPRYPDWSVMAPITAQVPNEENKSLLTAGYTIGGRIIWPRNKVDGKITINGARGMHPRIKNRFDLTVECVRRHYLAVPSPMGRTMARYPEFFALFEDFRGYVDFFLLQDLVTDDYAGVRFLLPFDDFRTPAMPRDVDSYTSYCSAAIKFVTARNHRIGQWAREQASPDQT